MPVNSFIPLNWWSGRPQSHANRGLLRSFAVEPSLRSNSTQITLNSAVQQLSNDIFKHWIRSVTIKLRGLKVSLRRHYVTYWPWRLRREFWRAPDSSVSGRVWAVQILSSSQPARLVWRHRSLGPPLKRVRHQNKSFKKQKQNQNGNQPPTNAHGHRLNQTVRQLCLSLAMPADMFTWSEYFILLYFFYFFFKRISWVFTCSLRAFMKTFHQGGPVRWSGKKRGIPYRPTHSQLQGRFIIFKEMGEFWFRFYFLNFKISWLILNLKKKKKLKN